MLFVSACLLLVAVVLCQDEGWVTSPQHPLAYSNNSTLTWSQCAKEGYFVSLTLIHLDMEISSNCKNDALMIFKDNHLVKSLCGSMSFKELQSSVNPHLISTSGGCLSIYFRSDEVLPQLHTGFRAFYKMQDVDECASHKNPCSHFCYNFIGGFRCGCRLGYILNPKTNNCDVINCGEPKYVPNGHVQFIKGSNNEYLSAFKYHCNEPFYTSNEIQKVSFICDAEQQWRKIGSNRIPPCRAECGKHKITFGKIWGGQAASRGSFPWQVLLCAKGNLAGGFIIDEKWIMTAAHNFRNCPSPPPTSCIKVHAGHNLRNETEKFIHLNVSSIHIHPDYNKEDLNNDIALIKLHTPVTFNETVRPVCLPSADIRMRGMGIVSGFGMTADGLVNQLQYVVLPIVDQKTCRKSFGNDKNINLTENMFCAGFKMEEKDSCTGDSGSAFIKQQQGKYYAVGIVSWGRGCAMENEYGVYTRVAQYLNWINKTMIEN